MIRLFVALPIPDAIRDDLSQMCHGFPHVHWVDWDNFHLTLRFVGNVDHGIAEDIDDALSRIEVNSLEIIPENLSWFGNKKYANAIVFRAQRTEALIHLQKKVEVAMQQVGLKPESRKFCPHITLARMRDVRTPMVEDFVGSRSMTQLSPFSVDRMVLYSSTLTSRGPIYREEASYPFIDYSNMFANFGDDFWKDDIHLSDEMP